VSLDLTLNSSLWGITRGLCVHTLIYPLEVVKIRQQSLAHPQKSSQVAWALYQKEGPGAFYKGLSPQLLKTCLKQAWCWPLITGSPVFLQRYSIEDPYRHLLTGLFIATIDAGISTPLERAKIRSAFSGKASLSVRGTYKEGWRGFTTHWAKLSVNWSTFLMAQRYFRERSHTQTEQALSISQLTKVGIQVALTVSVVAAPFDLANTLKQTHNRSPSHLFSRAAIRTWYRGWPLSALSLSIHNIASVIVIDRLEKTGTTRQC
jgi:hypothetical protein